ncbi:MAG: hypothetical protein V9G12_17995 [Microthrixaceae bacterium]
MQAPEIAANVGTGSVAVALEAPRSRGSNDGSRQEIGAGTEVPTLATQHHGSGAVGNGGRDGDRGGPPGVARRRRGGAAPGGRW